MIRYPVLLAAVLAACSATPAPEPASRHGEAVCSEAGLDKFVGQHSTPMLGDEIIAASGARIIRWLGPDQAATDDFRDDRITANYASARIVTSLRCG